MLGWIFNCSKPTDYIDSPFSAVGTPATYTGNFTSSTWQLICLALAYNQKLIYYGDSKRSWKPTLHCVGECLTPVAITASLFLHQIRITTGITPNPSLTESQPAVLQMKTEHPSAQPPGTKHLSIKPPCWTASKQALFTMTAESSQNIFFSSSSQAFLPQGHICCSKLKWFFWW